MSRDTVVRADAIVIGTGAGGGPVAAALAERGLRVVVLEAGPRVETGAFSGEAGAMIARLYRMDVAPASGMSVYAGACAGGSTVINDALCFRPPADVLAAWRDRHGLGGLTEAAFAPFVERAWRDVHAEPTGRTNASRNAQRLAEGARRLGWSASATPRNVIGCANLGLCNFGCPSGAKQSTLVTYLPRAERAGARTFTDTRAERIVVEAGRVRGVDATIVGGETRRAVRAVRVEAPFVCVAAGVLGTPVLLQQSGIPAGRGVRMHSSVHVSAEFAEPIHGYYGPTMSWAIDELADVNGRTGPGVMIESVSAHPIAVATAIPGFGASHEAAMRRLSHFARALVVIRDRTEGGIAADGTIEYAMRADDLDRLRAGIAAAARAFLAAGAVRVHVPVHGVAPLRSDAACARLAERPLAPSDLAGLYAVHLFGGAAMAARPQDGTCDERGAVFGVRGLHVVDAAALPSNTGVNPQITIMANALRVADGIARAGA